MPDKFMMSCDVCDKKFQQGPGRYEGHTIARYKMTVCDPCWQGNWDGWGPAAEPRVLDHLKEQGIPVPPRNAKGWIPRGD